GSQTLNARSYSLNERSHHPAPRTTKKNTSDVLKILDGRELTAESPGSPEGDGLNARSVFRLLAEEKRARPRVALARLLEWTLLLEQLDRTEDPLERRLLLRARGGSRRTSATTETQIARETLNARSADCERP